MKNHFLSVIDYAKLCGVSRTVIYKRIERGEVTIKRIGSVIVVDVVKSTIRGAGAPNGRPSVSKAVNQN